MSQIIVVEDEKDIRESIIEILELNGYAVDHAIDGKDGLEKIVELDPDLVISDINMPHVDGFEMLAALNQHYDEDAVFPSFLFLTARAELEDMNNALSLGADDYLIKPFHYQDLLDRIQARLSKRKRLVESGRSDSRKLAENLQFNRLALPTQDGFEVVEYEKIVTCTADRAYCSFNLDSGKTLVISKPMKEYEDALLSRRFMKVHKSTIVNIDRISKYVRGKAGYLVLEDGSTVSVSLRKKEDVLRMLRDN